MYKFFFISLLTLFSTFVFSENKTIYITPNQLEQPQGIDITQNIDNMDNTLQQEFPEIGYKGAFIKMFLSLIAVVVLGGLTLWSFKRLNKSRIYSANQNKEIKILEKRILSPKSILYLIEYNGKKIIISESHLDMKIKVLE